ncbi:MAG: lysylphosphatidylglycerol synthase transmembrane domain-containing protein [Chloroflexota bacterium]
MKGKLPRILRSVGICTILAALLFFAMRDAPLPDIWSSLRQLKLWQLAVLLALNLSIYSLVTLRWWLIAKAGKRDLPFIPLLGVRVSVFGVSYFTLGPQIGGEPLQVLYMQRKYGMSYTRATSTVVMDKLLEFLANFFLLAFGLTGILEAGILFTNGSRPFLSLIGLVLPLAWPLIHLVLLYHGKRPLTAILHSAVFLKRNSKSVRFIAASEHLAGRFCRRNPSSLIFAIFVSLVAAVGMVSEFFLFAAFLKIDLSFWQTIAAWTAGWLAFLVPLPGGLGALEASQVFALGLFGIPAASAIGITLIMRGRDLLIGGIGLLLAGRGIR